MAVKAKIEKQPDGGFAVVFEEDGSGDLNRIMGDLCEKHKDDKDSHQTTAEIFGEIIQAIGEDSQKKEN